MENRESGRMENGESRDSRVADLCWKKLGKFAAMEARIRFGRIGEIYNERIIATGRDCRTERVISGQPHLFWPQKASHQEEDLSDPDLQDEESGEELPQQPLQGNTHSSSDNASAQAGTPTPLTHLNSLMGAHHPHFLAKLKMEDQASLSYPVKLGLVSRAKARLKTETRMENWKFERGIFSPQPSDVDALNNKSGLEALQAAMGGGGFNLPFSFPPPAAFLTPQHHSQNSHPQSGGGIGSGVGNQVTSSASSHSSESSQGSARNGGEPRESSNHSQSNSTGTNHQQQTSWSFEEQFKQVRQASTYVYLATLRIHLLLFTRVIESTKFASNSHRIHRKGKWNWGVPTCCFLDHGVAGNGVAWLARTKVHWDLANIGWNVFGGYEDALSSVVCELQP
ncbi:hypothetical protein WN48_06935 [Eufriesea mexicana]|uniref:Uncharacterized protein n=1 Tax=Eufriesea mexicana TaxID=516756 RepID=A0A310SSE8_9HYME|nr:hypothetical protein WN48_06935 [Eufriesea mexicana]